VLVVSQPIDSSSDQLESINGYHEPLIGTFIYEEEAKIVLEIFHGKDKNNSFQLGWKAAYASH
jgi:hypothetical protein